MNGLLAAVKILCIMFSVGVSFGLTLLGDDSERFFNLLSCICLIISLCLIFGGY